MLDTKFPNSARRPELHAKLLEFYASAGESDAVIQGGREFLANFPNAPQRTSVALLMADAYSRKGDSASEFAIYDSVLQELAAAGAECAAWIVSRWIETRSDNYSMRNQPRLRPKRERSRGEIRTALGRKCRAPTQD